jgi:CRISPR-associated protein Csd2
METDATKHVPQDILNLYEVHNFGHAAEILATGFPDEYAELLEALRTFRITVDEILAKGGNESTIPKSVSKLLRKNGWFETQIHADLHITQEMLNVPGLLGVKGTVKETETIERYIDGHRIDYVKKKVAFDLEWNSKDQTFDRDLYAFRTFFECGAISAAVLMTRSASLNPVFQKLKVRNKYGASTTWMGKLLYRIRAGRGGGCPILVIGITPKLISDWENYE